MDDNPENSRKQKEEIKKIFHNLFIAKGFKLNNRFDRSVWFMNSDNFYSHRIKRQTLDEILNETPKENDNDILKYILMKAFSKPSSIVSDAYSIKVVDFIEAIADYVDNLNEELVRVEKLIKKYDAYQTKNNIELNLQFYESQMKEASKSTFNMEIVQIDNIPKGDYKISLLVSFIHNANNVSSYKIIDNYDDDKSFFREEILDYKMYQTVRVQEELCKKFECGGDYVFQPVDFYSYENKNNIQVSSSNESGTNISHFNLKFENLSGRYEEITMSDKVVLLGRLPEPDPER